MPSSKNSLLACVSNINKIYPSVNITGTTTSRLSMTKVNLAQYPSSRSELGKIRKCIIPTKDYKFCYFDFAAMEVRLTASITQEPTILEAINNNLDLHSMTALKVFGHKMKELDMSLPLKDKLDFIKKTYGNTFRYWSKSLIFSLLYGTTEFGLSKNLNISQQEAIDMIKDFFNGYTKVKEFMDNNKKQAIEKGYVENLHGMRLNVPECLGWNSKYKNYKAERQIRQSGNYLIQSLNATYLYKAIITFMKEVRDRNLDIHLLFTIYDSVMVEVHESIDNNIVIDLFKRHFESKINGVPIEIDIAPIALPVSTDCIIMNDLTTDLKRLLM
jgi:DNA polymerase-1